MEGATTLGTAALDGTGTGALTLNTLAVGTHSITAVYAATLNYMGSTSSALSQVVQDFNFNLSGVTVTTLPSATVMPGNAAVFTVQMSPTTGTTFAGAVALTLTGLPASVTSYTISPSTIPAGSGTTLVTVTIYTAGVRAAASSPNSGSGFPKSLLLALLLPLLGGRKLRRALHARLKASLLIVVLGLLMVMGMVACGSGSGFIGQGPQTYPLTLTGTSGVLHHSVTLNLTIQ